MTGTGSHTPTAYEAPPCGGCGRPMVCTKSGLWECDHQGGPPAGDGLPGVSHTPVVRTKPRRIIELSPINGHIGNAKPPVSRGWTG